MIIPYGQATNQHRSHVSSWFLKPGDPGLNSGVLQGPNIAGHTVCCTHTLAERETKDEGGGTLNRKEQCYFCPYIAPFNRQKISGDALFKDENTAHKSTSLKSIIQRGSQ